MSGVISTYANQLEDMIRDEADRRLANGQVDGALAVLNSYESQNLLPIYADICIQSGRDAESQSAIQKLSTYPTTHQNYHLSEVLPIVALLKKTANKHKALQPYKQKLLELYNNGDLASFKAAALLAAFGDTILAPYLPVDTGHIVEPETPTNFWGTVPIVNKSYLRVYPSPASNEVTINGSIPDSQILFIEITDGKGATVFKEQYKSNELKTNIDTRAWQSGAYFVRLSSDVGLTKSAKVIVNH